MGTSKRKTTIRIKKLLDDTLQNDPEVKIEKVIPDVAKETMKTRRTKNYFGDKEFAVLAGGGISCFKQISSVGYAAFLQDHDIDEAEKTPLKIQKIIEAILDEIEKENGDIHSSFILNAFKLTMTKVLMDNTTDPRSFLVKFCEVFLEMIIRESASENLISAFNDTTPDNIDERISEFSIQYVEHHFSDLIDACINDDINIVELVAELQKRLDK